MGQLEHFAWRVFEATGGVKEYLKYKALADKRHMSEVGEEFGIDKDIRNNNKDHQIR